MSDSAADRSGTSRGSGKLAVAQSETSTNASEKLYEGMFILDSSKFAANPEGVARHLLEILDKAGATVMTHRPWQDGRLAYEIEGKRKGLHYLAYFRMTGPGISLITRSCKLSEFVLRHIVIRQPQTLFDAMVGALSGQEESETAQAEESDTTKTIAEPDTTETQEADSAAAESPADGENADANAD